MPWGRLINLPNLLEFSSRALLKDTGGKLTCTVTGCATASKRKACRSDALFCAVRYACLSWIARTRKSGPYFTKIGD
eukprot:6206858-Pleurochrysis_carterae.AAC.8